MSIFLSHINSVGGLAGSIMNVYFSQNNEQLKGRLIVRLQSKLQDSKCYKKC